jgi:hypothetical protein
VASTDERVPYRISESRYFKALHPKVKLATKPTLTTCITCHPSAQAFNFRKLSVEAEYRQRNKMVYRFLVSNSLEIDRTRTIVHDLIQHRHPQLVSELASNLPWFKAKPCISLPDNIGLTWALPLKIISKSDTAKDHHRAAINNNVTRSNALGHSGYRTCFGRSPGSAIDESELNPFNADKSIDRSFRQP